MAKPGATEVSGIRDNAVTGFSLITLGFLDFVGDPLRATNNPYGNVTVSGSSDTELNGTFDAVPADMVSLSPITHTSENSNTVTATLSGLITLDSALMTLVGNRSNWAGRDAIFWLAVYDAVANQVGAPWRHYTGRMVNVSFSGSGSNGSITVEIENYLAALSQPSNRSYLSQEEFDANDLSAAASIASANGSRRGAVYGSGGGGGGNGRDFRGESLELY